MGKKQQTNGNGGLTTAKGFNQELDLPPQVTHRYSDDELLIFKDLIDKKIEEIKDNIESSKQEDLSELLPSVIQSRTRSENQIKKLELALSRIQNKTYGICSSTGKLIPKERLRLQLTATKTVEAENMAQRPGFSGPKEPNAVPFNQELDINNSDDWKFIKKNVCAGFPATFFVIEIYTVP